MTNIQPSEELSDSPDSFQDNEIGVTEKKFTIDSLIFTFIVILVLKRKGMSLDLRITIPNPISFIRESAPGTFH